MESSEIIEETPSFPPLLSGEATTSVPFEIAIERAREGTDAGLIVHRIRPDLLSAAIVLAPEDPLENAMAMIFAAANGFADAFGALAPSEVAAQFDWPGGIRINGAKCGRFRAAASTHDPSAIADWLVIGLELPFFAAADDEPGSAPDRTTLWDEGCGEIEPRQLLESWSRHMLVWINTWLDEGMPRLHGDWRGRAFAIGEHVEFDLAGNRYAGEFVGLDELGSILLKCEDGTQLLPLSKMLEEV
jgi:BirA family biotin operon repressor/biotin-[acetyl-CoA-carboxylase] ligase